jgi:hypothetical protein
MNYLFLKLLQQRRSRSSRRVAQIVQLRMESAYLNTTTLLVQLYLRGSIVVHLEARQRFTWFLASVTLCT